MKIAIVNDMPLAAEALRRVVVSAGQHEVIWIAGNGIDAVELCVKQRPDLILMDLLMPVMGGVEATRRIMSTSPCAILIVTANVGANAARVFEAMGAGALDAVDAPGLGLDGKGAGAALLLNKIKALGHLIVDRSPRIAMPPRTASRFALIAIGASAGGPAALGTLLHSLPANLGAAVVIIQHVDAQFAAGMAAWLSQQSNLPVRCAREGDQLQVNEVLLAGTNDHLVLKDPTRLGYTAEPKDYVYRPSVDVFFQSVCQHWPGRTIGVLLTGMGRDGADGLKLLRNKGFLTIAQDQQSSAVFGMPKAAAKLNAAVEILPLPQIAPRLVRALAHDVDFE